MVVEGVNLELHQVTRNQIAVSVSQPKHEWRISCFELLWLLYNKQHQFYILNPYKAVVTIYSNHAQGLNGVAIKIKSRKHRQ